MRNGSGSLDARARRRAELEAIALSALAEATVAVHDREDARAFARRLLERDGSATGEDVRFLSGFLSGFLCTARAA